MTTTGEPTTSVTGMPDFEERTVIRSAVKITKAGDGLSDALKVKPIALHHGDRVFFVLEGEVRAVNHVPAEKGSDLLVRTHVVDATDIALVTEDQVRALLDENRDRVQRMLDSMDGQGVLDDPDDGLEALQDALEAGGIDTSDPTEAPTNGAGKRTRSGQ